MVVDPAQTSAGPLIVHEGLPMSTGFWHVAVQVLFVEVTVSVKLPEAAAVTFTEDPVVTSRVPFDVIAQT